MAQYDQRASGQRPAPPTSHMESTITRLLVATKQLLESLAKWSRGELNEDEISSIYVRLGNDFNVACTAFVKEGISMDELMSVPQDLRVCLEQCLSDEPSQATLERHLPQVRQIIIGLLHGLREKQRLYREGATARKARDDEQRTRSSRDHTGGSISSRASVSSSLAPKDAGTITPNSANRSREDLRKFVNKTQSISSQPSTSRTVSSSSIPTAPGSYPDTRPASPTASMQSGRGSLSQGGPRPQAPPQRTYSTEEAPFIPPTSSGASSLHSKSPSVSRSESFRSSRKSTAESFHSDTVDGTPTPQQQPQPQPRPNGSFSAARHSAERTRAFSPPPPQIDEAVPPTPTLDGPGSPSPTLTHSASITSSLGSPTARPGPNLIPMPSPTTEASQTAAQLQSLEALKQSDNLSRRASKRYSAYAIQKMTTGSGGSPGRGEAGRDRSGSDLSRGIGSGSSAGRELAYGSGEDRKGGPSARPRKSEFRPTRGANAPPMPSIPSSLAQPPTIAEEDSSRENTPFLSPAASFSTQLATPLVAEGSPELPSASPSPLPPQTATVPAPPAGPAASPSISQHVRSQTINSEQDSDADAVVYPISVFLKIGRDVKKAKLEEKPTLASLRLLFIERFQYNPGQADFPSINLRDQTFGVEYVLEDINEVRNGSVISLGIDSVDQVKQHIDQGLLTLAQDIRELRTTVTTMRRASTHAGAAVFSPEPHASPIIKAPSERQYADTAQKVLRMKRAGSQGNLAGEAAIPAVPGAAAGATATDANVIKTLKTQHEEVQNLRREIGVLRQVYVDFANQTKTLFGELRVQTSRVQTLAATKISADRSFVQAGTAKLESESADLIIKGDEVQDAIDQMKADFLRGIRITPGQLSEVASNLASVTRKRKELVEWVAAEKPSWKLLWSTELTNIINEETTVKDQEGFLAELNDDLEDVAAVFKNIQQAAKHKQASQRPIKEFVPAAPDEEHQGLSTVLLEVKSLNPNPERRLEAIQRAEAERQKKLENRTDEFADELGDFVQSGKLKKSGGVEETERLREARSQATLKAMFNGA